MFKVQGLGLGFKVQGSGFMVQFKLCQIQIEFKSEFQPQFKLDQIQAKFNCLGFAVQGLPFRAYGFGFRVQGSRFNSNWINFKSNSKPNHSLKHPAATLLSARDRQRGPQWRRCRSLAADCLTRETHARRGKRHDWLQIQTGFRVQVQSLSLGFKFQSLRLEVYVFF